MAACRALRDHATRPFMTNSSRFDGDSASDLPILKVAAVALVDSNDRVLLAQRPAGKSMAGLWEFPGGKIEHAETPEQALVRELGEELGIAVEIDDLMLSATAEHDYERFHLHMPLFLCRRWQGRPSPHEGQALAWVRPAEMAGYDMPPADAPLVAKLIEQLRD